MGALKSDGQLKCSGEQSKLYIPSASCHTRVVSLCCAYKYQVLLIGEWLVLIKKNSSTGPLTRSRSTDSPRLSTASSTYATRPICGTRSSRYTRIIAHIMPTAAAMLARPSSLQRERERERERERVLSLPLSSSPKYYMTRRNAYYSTVSLLHSHSTFQQNFWNAGYSPLD